MEKFPFNNKGLWGLQTKLYLLSDEILEVEAQLIRNDLKNWIRSHFKFTTDQLNYLNSIDPKAKNLIESLTSFAVENRLPITFNKKNKTTGGDGAKITWPKNVLTATSGGSIGYTTCGTLEINIDYEI